MEIVLLLFSLSGEGLLQRRGNWHKLECGPTLQGTLESSDWTGERARPHGEVAYSFVSPPQPGPVTPLCGGAPAHQCLLDLPTMTKESQNWTPRLGVAPSPSVFSEFGPRCNGRAPVGRIDPKPERIESQCEGPQGPREIGRGNLHRQVPQISQVCYKPHKCCSVA